ncbi:MAG: hypothetical protein K6A43_08015 [Treponema sp.]|nr:hypothetical protein [Treponema sp.]
MENKNRSGAQRHFGSVIRLFLLIALCVASSLILVWPLWKFSTSFPKVYTVIVLALIGGAAIFFAVKKIIKSDKISVIRFFVNLILIALTIILCVSFILGGNRLLGLIIFLAGIALEILANIIFSKISQAKNRS